jgi:Ca2+-binding EF-hand superfamily protein
MKSLKTGLLATLLATAFAAPAAFADASADGAKGDRAQKMHERLKAADKNGDGKISREEANASLPRLAKNFDAIDTNKDGFITKEEMRAFHEKNGGRKPRQS